ncbi:hypothetical protein [Pseudomonas sp. NBRC 100443]|uniref:hypothetical protein n=1 Tax=Pseudomonas sp. NBRC 100443 TaxID=1113665 RepID=UPI0024A19383|nr:hypothetical protein [Pseudomonas sp. NBRC 100443]GLU42315.1 hypothetical protein Pssp01_64080 [Pseudomonas sp. NBRC 100443]
MEAPTVDTFVNLAVGLVGAVIGGCFTLHGTKIAHKLAMEKETNAERERMVSTLMLLRTEINAAWRIFKKEIGDELLAQNDETPYLTLFPIGESPFPLFNSAPHALNLLPHDLAQDIVHFYMRAKGLIAMIEMNNRDYEQALQYARSQLASYLDQARQKNLEMPEDMQQRIFKGGVDFMAALLGMGSTADGMRGLSRELDPVVGRITAAVDDLLVPI